MFQVNTKEFLFHDGSKVIIIPDNFLYKVYYYDNNKKLFFGNYDHLNGMDIMVLKSNNYIIIYEFDIDTHSKNKPLWTNVLNILSFHNITDDTDIVDSYSNLINRFNNDGIDSNLELSLSPRVCDQKLKVASRKFRHRNQNSTQYVTKTDEKKLKTNMSKRKIFKLPYSQE